MLYHEQSDNYRPLFSMNGHPVYANTLLVSAHVAAFIAAALAISAYGLGTVGDAVSLDPLRIFQEGQVWRLFSYVSFDWNFFSIHSLGFLWSMLLLFFFGREVEQYTGRKTYLTLYAALILIPAVLLCLFSLLAGPVSPHLDCFEAIFGVFVAFATLYPGAMPTFLWLPFSCSTLVWILLAIFSLIDIAQHAGTSLFMLGASSSVGYLGMRLIGAGHGLTWFTDWIENRQAQRLAQQRNLKVLKDARTNESIDEILDKISQHGVGSLNDRERAALEHARTKLLKRDQR